MIWAKRPPYVKVSAGSHRASTKVSSQAERFGMSPRIRCSSASVFSSLCSRARGERCDLGGPFISISARDREGVQTSLVKIMFSNSCLRVLFDSRQGSSSTTVGSGRSNCSSVKVPAYSNKRRVCQESLPANDRINPCLFLLLLRNQGQKSEFCWTPANESADHARADRCWEKSEKLFGKRE